MDGTIKRVLIGAIAPAPIALLLIYANMLFNGDIEFKLQILKSYLFFLAYAYLFIGIQSILYSFVMEFLVNRRIENGFLVVLSSIFLGVISPSILHFDFGGGMSGIYVLGGLTGVIVGGMLRLHFLNSANKAKQEGTS